MKRDPAIDIVKGIVLVFVVVYHGIRHDLARYTYFQLLTAQVLPVLMVVAGYNGALSFARRGVSSLREMLSGSYFARRLGRLAWPFLFVWACENAARAAFSRGGGEFAAMLHSLVTGGYGPGSYFVPVILQVVIVIPFIYAVSRWSAAYMVMLVFLVNVVLEYAAYRLPIGYDAYRLLIIRYLFAVSLGVYLAVTERVNRLFLVAGTIVGCLYIYILKNARVPVLNELQWSMHKAPAYVLALAVVIVAMTYLPRFSEILPFRMMRRVGAASYHVFLVQMAYFYFLSQFTRLHLKGNILFAAANVVICCVAGVVFYLLESKVREIVGGRLRRTACP